MSRLYLKRYQEIYVGTMIGLLISISDFFLDYWTFGETTTWDKYNKEHLDVTTGHFIEHVAFVLLGALLGMLWYSTANQYREFKSLVDGLKEERDFNQLLLDIIVHDIANNNLVSQSYLGLLQEEVDKPSAIELLHKIDQTTAKTILLTENINILTQLKSQTIKNSSLNLISIVNNAITQIKLAYKKDDLKFKVDIPEKIVVDAHNFMETVFINLISNSIKYKKKDQKIIKIEIKASYTEEGILIAVGDHGRGIDDSLKEKLFQRFVREEESKSFGKGLGLSISKRVVDLLCGKIWIENRPESLHDHTAGTIIKILLKGRQN